MLRPERFTIAAIWCDTREETGHNVEAHSFSHQLWVAGVIKRECASSCGELQPLRRQSEDKHLAPHNSNNANW